MRVYLGLCAPLALMACNSGPSVTATNASSAEVAAKVKAAGVADKFVAPGQWQTVMTIQDISIPGMTPDMVRIMKGHIGAPKTFESCLTAAEAAKPKEDFFAKGNGNCRYDRFAMGGGKIDAAMTCRGEGIARKMTMSGTYSADAYQMTMASAGTPDKANPMAGMTMKMELAAKRTGACTGKENG